MNPIAPALQRTLEVSVREFSGIFTLGMAAEAHEFSSAGTKRFLLTSSGCVYGPQPPALEWIPKDYNGMPDPLNQANAYSVAKRVAEHLCALYQHKNEL